MEALPKTTTIEDVATGTGGEHDESSNNNDDTITMNHEENNAAITLDRPIKRTSDINNIKNNNNINLADSKDGYGGVNREGEATSTSTSTSIHHSTTRPMNIKQQLTSNNNETHELEQHQHPIVPSIPSSRKSSSSVTPANLTTPTSTSPRLDEEKIEKAEAFLLNPEITDVPTESKRRYLETKGNLTQDEIDVALQRVVVTAGKTRRDGRSGMQRHSNDDGLQQQQQQRQQQRQRQRRNYNDQFRDNRDLDQYYQEDDGQQYNDTRNPRHRGGGGGSMGERIPPHPSQYPTPHHDSNTTTPMPPYDNNNNNMHSPPPGSTPDEMMPPPPSTSTSILPAWAGGFSFGIFCLAALRWLNGGDFVLFPPPSLASSSSSSSSDRRIGNVEHNMSGGSGAMKEEEGNEDDTDESQDSQQEEDDLAEEDADYEEEEEVGVDEGDEDLTMLLNGTANIPTFRTATNNTNSNLQPQPQQQQQQPSYDELVLEIRALTTAIHSYRDVQERANRNASAKAGKGMTDDAMDFLRQKKKKDGKVEKTEGKTAGEADTSSDGEGIGSSLVSMLTEVNGDLSRLKESISRGGVAGADDAKELEGDGDGANETVAGEKEKEESPSDQMDTKSAKDVDGANETDADKRGNEEEEEEPTAQIIDKVMEKVHRMLAVVVTLDSSKKDGGVADPTDEKSDGGGGASPDESEKESESMVVVPPESNAVSTTASSPTPSMHADEKIIRQGDDDPEQPPSAIEPPSRSNEELEEALRNLSNNNDPAALKVGAQMLYLYCLNISKNPSVPRYRKIYTNNANFKTKVGNLTGAKDFLSAVGFVERTSFFKWAAQQQQPQPSSEDVSASSSSSSTSLATKSRLDFALVALELMKNGVVSKSKPKTEESVLASSSPSSESNVECGGTKEVPGLALSGVLSVPGVGEGVDLN